MIDPTDSMDAAQGQGEAHSSGSTLVWDSVVQELDVRMAILDRYADWQALIHLLKQRDWQVRWQEQDTILMIRTAS